LAAIISAVSLTPSLLFYCGTQVIELFSPGYFIPRFFGALAATSGLQHAHIYTGLNQTAEFRETAMSTQSVALRQHARSLDICVPLDVTFQQVRHMIDQWRTCCAAKP
jgi:hypothetical protein